MSDKLEEVLSKGGLVKIQSVSVIVDNPDNLEEYGSLTGFKIKNSLGWGVYFKTKDRAKAQNVCNFIFGDGVYRVNPVN